jgi:hypothetical protein
MSHLSTLIERVNLAEERGWFENPERHQEYVRKRVRNLREYVEQWNDYSELELVLALQQYKRHKDVLKPEEKLQPFEKAVAEEDELTRFEKGTN